MNVDEFISSPNTAVVVVDGVMRVLQKSVLRRQGVCRVRRRLRSKADGSTKLRRRAASD